MFQDNEAIALFRKGIEYEREGKHYEATHCYKRALKLDADIEKKIDYGEPASCPMDTCCMNKFTQLRNRLCL